MSSSQLWRHSQEAFSSFRYAVILDMLVNEAVKSMKMEASTGSFYTQQQTECTMTHWLSMQHSSRNVIARIHVFASHSEVPFDQPLVPAGVAAGPAVALLPAAYSRHSAGFCSRVPEAAPGSSRHTGMIFYSCAQSVADVHPCELHIKLATSSFNQVRQPQLLPGAYFVMRPFI